MTEGEPNVDGPEIDGETVDDGNAPSKREPIRRCLASGARRPREELIRFVLGPDGTPVPDLAAKLPGRGMWLSADAGSIKTALDRKLFAKAARKAVTPVPDLAARVEHLLVRRCVELLSLARRAGEAVCGFEKVRAALSSGSVAGDGGVLIQASDGAADGRGKLSALTRGDIPVVALLTADEIGEAFGRDTSVHAVVMPGGLGRAFLLEAGRLKGFRGTDPM